LIRETSTTSSLVAGWTETYFKIFENFSCGQLVKKKLNLFVSFTVWQTKRFFELGTVRKRKMHTTSALANSWA